MSDFPPLSSLFLFVCPALLEMLRAGRREENLTRQRQGLRVWELQLLDICSKLIVDTIKIRNKNSKKEKTCEEQRLEHTPSASNLSPHHNHLHHHPHHHPHPQFFSLSSTPRIIHLPKKGTFSTRPQNNRLESSLSECNAFAS